jgi:hypothetical protein
MMLATSPAAPVLASPPQLGDYYVALGDGYALGYLTADLPADPQCEARDAPGYVCVVYRYLKQANPGLQIRNYGEQNADSCELAGGGHRCFDMTSVSNPVDGAVAFIQQHPGEVNPITLSLGGSDLLPLLPQALTDPVGTAGQLPAVLTRFQANLNSILARLRVAAGPNAELIVTTQVNPLDGIPSPPLPSGIPDLATNAIAALNTAAKAAAMQNGAIVADAADAFHTYPGGPTPLTWAATSLASGDPSKVNPYPTPDGYKVLARTIIKVSGYVVPLAISAKLRSKTIGAGQAEKVKGKTSVGASITATVRFPNKKQMAVTTSPDNQGKYALSFKVGKTRGTGWVKVCASDITGQSKCSGKLAYMVK